MHLEIEEHIIDVFIVYSERKIMRHVVDSDLHYKMCFVTIQGVATGREPRAGVCKPKQPPTVSAPTSYRVCFEELDEGEKKKTEVGKEREDGALLPSSATVLASLLFFHALNCL